MVLWTIVPTETIFEYPSGQPSYEDIEVGGAWLTVEKFDNSHYRVIRLITTNPNDYLRPEFQPGYTLKLMPVFEAL